LPVLSTHNNEERAELILKKYGFDFKSLPRNEIIKNILICKRYRFML